MAYTSPNYQLVKDGLETRWRAHSSAFTQRLIKSMMFCVGAAWAGVIVGWMIFQVPSALAETEYALSLNGTNQYVTLPATNWYSLSFTMEAWVYVKQFNSNSVLARFGLGNLINDSVVLSLNGAGLPTLTVFSNEVHSALTGLGRVPLGRWTHLAATLSVGPVITTGNLYVNGQSVGTGTMNNPKNLLRTSNYLGSESGTQGFANVRLDEVRIWIGASSQATIRSNMNFVLKGNEAGLLGLRYACW